MSADEVDGGAPRRRLAQWRVLGASVVCIGAALVPAVPAAAATMRSLGGTDRVVALTFDDGPDPEATPAVLDVLARYGVPGTFFVTGAGAEAEPAVVREIVRDGQVVASHGWQHVDLTRLGPDAVRASVSRADAALQRIAGVTPPCVRPPYGAIDASVSATLTAMGKTAVLWNVDPRDWSQPGVATIVSRVLSAVRPGSVVLLHPGRHDSQTVAALPAIIEGLRARGYRFTSVCDPGDAVRSVPEVSPFAGAPSWAPARVVSSVRLTGAAATPSGRGVWAVGVDGGVFTLGDAVFEGSLGGTRLNAPVVGIAATPSGRGYWSVAADGGVFAFGDAVFAGSLGGTRLNAPVVGIAATPSGRGYWLVAADGGVFAFGDAVFAGSLGGIRLNAWIVGIAAAPGGGYLLVAADGGVFPFGGAPFLGSWAPSPAPVVGIAAAVGGGYWLLDADGHLASFGGAGGAAPVDLSPRARPVAVLGLPSGGGAVVVSAPEPFAP